jgi:16S rRNA (guanine527-N7)-methyltransferase
MELISGYFPELDQEKTDRFSLLHSLYSDWNQRINVISRKDIDQLYLRHVLHSLAIAKYVSFAPGSSVLDVGTGGGFPGIPLAIMFPETEFLLVDSIQKKIRVVNEVASELKLTNCHAEAVRAESLKMKHDFIVTRAVTVLPRLISWVRKLISAQQNNEIPNGILALKGGDLTEELNIPQKTSVVNLSEYFSEPFFETKKLVHVIMKGRCKLVRGIFFISNCHQLNQTAICGYSNRHFVFPIIIFVFITLRLIIS